MECCSCRERKVAKANRYKSGNQITSNQTAIPKRKCFPNDDLQTLFSFKTHRSTVEGFAAAAGAAAAAAGAGALVSFLVLFATATLAAGAPVPSSSESPKAAKKFFDYIYTITKEEFEFS
jgi:hypothetical protein